jgi:hypothetical protein
VKSVDENDDKTIDAPSINTRAPAAAPTQNGVPPKPRFKR